MSDPARILIVCTGNLCRSPMVEAVLRATLDSDDFVVASAGTAPPEGAPVEAHAEATLAERGLELPGFASRRLTPEMVRDADLVLALHRDHRAAIARLLPAAAPRLFTVREFGRLAADVPEAEVQGATGAERLYSLLDGASRRRGIVRGESRRDDDIRDPLGRGDEAFTATLGAIEEALAPVIVRLGGHSLPARAEPVDTALALPRPKTVVGQKPGQTREEARRSAKRRGYLWRGVLGVASLVILFVVVYGVAFALSARSLSHRVSTLRSQVTALKTQAVQNPDADLSPEIATVQHNAQSARNAAHSTVWNIARVLPILGPAAHTVRGGADAVNDLAQQALPQLLTAQQALHPATLGASGSVKIGPLAQSVAPLTVAANSADAAFAKLIALPRNTAIGRVNKARNDLINTMAGITEQLETARDAATVLPSMLGGQGTRRYFLAFQNEDEARGLGGLPGAYAIVDATAGKISFERFGNDSDLGGVSVPSLDLGQDFDSQYATTPPTATFTNSSISPHFPYAAQIWIAMWKKKTGQQLDGAMVADPQVLSALLSVAGPTSLADGTPVTAANVVALSEQTAYARYPNLSDTPARKQFFINIAQAVSQHVLGHVGSNETALAKALASQIGQRRLLVYSTVPAEEAVLERQPIAGDLPETTAPFAMAVVSASTGQKLDYYIDRTLTYSGSSCTSGYRNTTLTFRVTNTAPKSGLPAYVTLHAAGDTSVLPLDAERLSLTFFLTDGAGLLRGTINGVPTGFTSSSLRGHPSLTTSIDINPGASQTITLQLYEPSTSGLPVVPVQPLVRPQQTAVTLPIC